MMGSIISEVPDKALKFSVNLEDPDQNDTISKVEVITNGGRVANSKSFTSNTVDWTFELPSIQGYYYLRITEADKNIAVTAPVWIGQAPLVGISSVDTATKMPVTGEPLAIEATLFNNEEASVTLDTISYSEGGVVLTTETLNETIPSTGTVKKSLNYVPSTAGMTTITATAVFTIAGQTKTFTYDIDLNVRASEQLVYVGIDASHYNEYVAGNYKDSMGNFANMAVDYDVRVVELDTHEALIAATQNPKYKMLVITPPTRRSGSAFLPGYKSYTDDEIDAIAAFAASGNTVIITGWGDYYESYTKYADGNAYTLPAEEQMSAQQNKLLKALGATLRLSDDEIKDDTHNGGQPQRLYLENVNLENIFLTGVNVAEQVYSNYGGSTLYGIDALGQPTTTLSPSVSPMVYAFETSYSSDDDGDGTTGITDVTVPKYNDKYMVAASETVTHDNGNTSTIIVAGSAFMSNFEIQTTMDSYSTPEYSNYTILENIVQSINPVTITDIADVQVADAGLHFTIQGIATSNASGYDQDTAFFDCIYLQDATGGINAFPVSGSIQAGQTVQITGKTSAYNGERQIAVEKISIIDENVHTLPDPITLTTADASNKMHLGRLVKIEGDVVSFTAPNDVVESIYVRDSSNTTCRIFIDGYITRTKAIDNLSVGAHIVATGLSSIDTDGARIRIRDRADIVCSVANNSSSGGSNKDHNKNNADTPATSKAPEVVSSVDNKDNKMIAKATMTLESTSTTPGKSSASVTNEMASSLIEEAKKSQSAGQKPVIALKMTSSKQDNAMAVMIPNTAFKSIASETRADVSVETDLGIITFSDEAVKAISESTASGDVNISIAKVDRETLSEEVQKQVGSRPVYDFSVNVGDQQISSFGEDQVRISLPYTPALGEDINAIVVYYVDDTGELQMMRGSYSATSGNVDFVTSHFSTYMIGYNKVVFTDVANSDWYHDAISFITSRSIAAGTDDHTFSPNEAVTRGQFMVMMMKAYGISPDTEGHDNFVDAGNTYYTAYLAAAKHLGLASGVGNNRFAPDDAISRQDMLTILYHTLQTLDELPTGEKVRSYSDYNDTMAVANYATSPVKTFVEMGIVSGSNGSLHPADQSSRAEIAQLLYNLLAVE